MARMHLEAERIGIGRTGRQRLELEVALGEAAGIMHVAARPVCSSITAAPICAEASIQPGHGR